MQSHQVDEGTRQRMDAMLFEVTNAAGNGVHGLLDAAYSFLQRRTDFYYVAEPGDKMGFPPGIAESMVYSYFRRYQENHERRFPPKPETKKRWEEFETQQKAAQKAAKEAAEAKKVEMAAKLAAGELEQAAKPEVKKVEQIVEKKAEEAPKKKEVAPPKEKSQGVKDMEKISTYNGDSTDKYAWSQSIQEVTIQIPIPEGTSAKMCDIKIKPKRLFVKIKDQEVPIIDGELQEKVKVEDSFWSIEDKKYINITFEKAYEAIWKGVVLGDAEIDPKTVDNSKRVEEFDLETQGHLQKVLYEQERKRNGLPTTDEEKQQKQVADIFAAQGMESPMAQLPYDHNKYGKSNMGSGSGPSVPFR